MELSALRPLSFDLWESHRLQLVQAFELGEQSEVLRWYQNMCAFANTSSSTDVQYTTDQVSDCLHWALNLAMYMSRITCVQVLLGLLDNEEVNAVRLMILPCNGAHAIDYYHLSDRPHSRLSSHLHVAAYLGSSLFIGMLLAKGASPLVLNSSGNTPLITLCRFSPHDHSLQAVKTLLGERWPGPWKKSYADMVNQLGLSALHYAVGRGLDDVVNFLLADCMMNVDSWKTPHPSQPGRFVGFSPLHVAIMKNNHWAVGRLLAAKADVHLFVPYLSMLQTHDTVPHLRICSMCDCGCSLHYQFAIAAVPTHHHLCSTLSLAAILEDSDTVVALLDAGADIEEKNSNGMTPLFESISNACVSSSRALLSYGANLDFVNYNGSTVLHTALCLPPFGCNAGSHRTSSMINMIVQQLLDTKNVQINARDHQGWTALMHASRNWFWSCVKLLVLNGAFLSTLNSVGRSALFYATFTYQVITCYKILKELIYCGAACLEPGPYDDNGNIQLWRSPAVPAIYNGDALALCLLYKGGLLRDRHLVSHLMDLSNIPQDNEEWSRLLCGFPVPTSEQLFDSNMFEQNCTDGEASEDKRETIHSSQQNCLREEEEMCFFDNKHSDWRELLCFCNLSEEEWPTSILDDDSVTSDDRSAEDGSSTVNEVKRLQLLQHFLQTVRTTVPTLLDLCRWEIRQLIGDDPLRRRKAVDTLDLPSVLLHSLMIGC